MRNILIPKIFFCLFLLFYPQTDSLALEPPVIRQNARASENAIRRRAFNVPEKASLNARRLTAYLVEPFETDIDKMRVIAYWIASHIAYDGYKYNAGQVNKRNWSYHYDIFRSKTGICTDFALLFQEMSGYAGIRGVKIVTGYVGKPTFIKRKRPPANAAGHAWNSVKIKGKNYYIDTTWMAPQKIIPKRKGNFNSWSHKMEVKRRSRMDTQVSADIRTFFFLFTPEDEAKNFGEVHYETAEY